MCVDMACVDSGLSVRVVLLLRTHYSLAPPTYHVASVYLYDDAGCDVNE